jgi:chemotaxis protein methyltransferase CheR
MTGAMSEDHRAALCRLIHDRSGMRLSPKEQDRLAPRLAPRLRELDIQDFDTYLAYLTTGPHQVEEFEHLLRKSGLCETGFFDGAPQLCALEQRILPELLEARSARKALRIWSAGCASGQEPYSIAMTLRRLPRLFSEWQVDLLATDISGAMLDEAADGMYDDDAMRCVPDADRDAHFKPHHPGWVIDPEIASLVSFERHDLRDVPGARRYGQWDVIFCRNVLARFDPQVRQSVLDALCAQLADDGVLFIGSAEDLEADAPLQRADADPFYRKKPRN